MGSRGLGITKRALLNLLAVGSGGPAESQAAGFGCSVKIQQGAWPADCGLRQAHSKPGCKGLASWWFG